MSKFMKAALASSVLVASVMGATAAKADTATATASANILEEITVSKDTGTDLDFGTIVADATGGNVVVGTDGTLGTCDLICTGTTDAADFSVTGTADEAVTLTVPATVTLTGPGADMTATLSDTGLTTLDATGAGSFSVGGTLAVAANQADGGYSGTFDVTVEYP